MSSASKPGVIAIWFQLWLSTLIFHRKTHHQYHKPSTTSPSFHSFRCVCAQRLSCLNNNKNNPCYTRLVIQFISLVHNQASSFIKTYCTPLKRCSAFSDGHLDVKQGESKGLRLSAFNTEALLFEQRQTSSVSRREELKCNQKPLWPLLSVFHNK